MDDPEVKRFAELAPDPGPAPARPLWRRFFSLPGSRVGRRSVILLGISGGFLLLSMIATALGARGGDTFLSGSPWLPLTIFPMIGVGIAAGAVGVFAVWARRERSVLVLPPILWGGLWIFFALGEVLVPH